MLGVLLKVVILCLLLVKVAEQHEVTIALVLTCGESILKEILIIHNPLKNDAVLL